MKEEWVEGAELVRQGRVVYYACAEDADGEDMVLAEGGRFAGEGEEGGADAGAGAVGANEEGACRNCVIGEGGCDGRIGVRGEGCEGLGPLL